MNLIVKKDNILSVSNTASFLIKRSILDLNGLYFYEFLSEKSKSRFSFSSKYDLAFFEDLNYITGISNNEIVVFDKSEEEFTDINSENSGENYKLYSNSKKISFEFKHGIRFYNEGGLIFEGFEDAFSLKYWDDNLICYYSKTKKSSYDTNHFTIRNFNNFEQKMDVDLTQYTAYKSSPIETKDGRILEFLGVHNNTLWLTTTNHNLFGIDVNTGEILHHFRDSPELKKGDFMFDYIGFGSRHATKLIEKESIIIGLTLSMSWQLDLTTKNWTFVDIRSQLGDRGHMTNVLSIDIDSAWFTSEPVIRDLHVGHLDRKTHKITTWRCKELHPDMRLVFTIIQKDNMVYMHDQGKRLFAFQLEEGELGQSL